MHKGIASSRQVLASRQRITPNSVGRLLVNDPGAPSTKHLMFKLNPENAARGPVQRRHAVVSFRRGSLAIFADEWFYLVESEKYAGWYYVMVQRNGEWQHSAGRATRKYIAKVEAMQAASAPAPAEQVAEHIEETLPLTAENAARGAVQHRQAKVDFTCGDLTIERRDWFYLVESEKYSGRYYVMVWRRDCWRASSKDYRMNNRCAEKIEEFKQRGREVALAAA